VENLAQKNFSQCFGVQSILRDGIMNLTEGQVRNVDSDQICTMVDSFSEIPSSKTRMGDFLLLKFIAKAGELTPEQITGLRSSRHIRILLDHEGGRPTDEQLINLKEWDIYKLKSWKSKHRFIQWRRALPCAGSQQARVQLRALHLRGLDSEEMLAPEPCGSDPESTLADAILLDIFRWAEVFFVSQTPDGSLTWTALSKAEIFSEQQTDDLEELLWPLARSRKMIPNPSSRILRLGVRWGDALAGNGVDESGNIHGPDTYRNQLEWLGLALVYTSHGYGVLDREFAHFDQFLFQSFLFPSSGLFRECIALKDRWTQHTDFARGMVFEILEAIKDKKRSVRQKLDEDARAAVSRSSVLMFVFSVDRACF